MKLLSWLTFLTLTTACALTLSGCTTSVPAGWHAAQSAVSALQEGRTLAGSVLQDQPARGMQAQITAAKAKPGSSALTVDHITRQDDRLRLTADTTPDGWLTLDGALQSGAAWKDLMIWAEDTDLHPFQTMVPVVHGQIHVRMPVPGPATHELFIGAQSTPGDSRYYSLASVTVTQHTSTPLTPVEYTNAHTTLDQPGASYVTVADSVPVAGSVTGTPHVVVAEVQKVGDDKLHAEYTLPVVNGRFAGKVWLRFGPGTYHIRLGRQTGAMSHEYTVDFYATNQGTRDLRYLAPSAGKESDDPVIMALAQHIISGHTQPGAQVQAIHDWVAQHIAYDVAEADNNSQDLADNAQWVLQRGKGVCADYTNLTVALVRAAGIPAREGDGKAYDGSAWGEHAWVEAQVDGTWVIMDPTWDAGHLTHGRFVADFSTSYFDPAPADFAQDHQLQQYTY